MTDNAWRVSGSVRPEAMDEEIIHRDADRAYPKIKLMTGYGKDPGYGWEITPAAIPEADQLEQLKRLDNELRKLYRTEVK